MSAPVRPPGPDTHTGYEPVSYGAASIDSFAGLQVDTLAGRIVRLIKRRPVVTFIALIVGVPLCWLLIVQDRVMYVIMLAFGLLGLLAVLTLVVKQITKRSSTRTKSEEEPRPAVTSRKEVKQSDGLFSARLQLVVEAYARRLAFLEKIRVAQAAIPTSPWSLRTWLFRTVKAIQSAFILLTGRGTSRLYVPLAAQIVRRTSAKSEVNDSVLTRAKVISVLVDKGGIGKTTFSFLLADLMKRLRPDLVVVLNDIDNGTLGERIRRTNKLSLVDFFNNLCFINEPTDLVRYCTMTANGLLVLPYAPPRLTSNLPKLSREQTSQVITTQQRVAGIIVNDLSPNLDERNQGALDTTDHLVIVTTPAKDSVVKALHTVRFLIDNGYGHLATSATIVVMRAKPWTRLEMIYQQFVDAFGDGVSDMTIARFNFSARLAAARDLDKSVVGPRTTTVLEEIVAHLLGQLSDARVSDPDSQLTHAELNISRHQTDASSVPTTGDNASPRYEGVPS